MRRRAPPKQPLGSRSDRPRRRPRHDQVHGLHLRRTGPVARLHPRGVELRSERGDRSPGRRRPHERQPRFRGLDLPAERWRRLRRGQRHGRHPGRVGVAAAALQGHLHDHRHAHRFGHRHCLRRSAHRGLPGEHGQRDSAGGLPRRDAGERDSDRADTHRTRSGSPRPEERAVERRRTGRRARLPDHGAQLRTVERHRRDGGRQLCLELPRALAGSAPVADLDLLGHERIVSGVRKAATSPPP